MKKALLLSASALAFSFASMAQIGAGTGMSGIGASTTGTLGQQSYMTQLTSRPFTLMNMQNLTGSPYLDQEFKAGTVKVRSGFTATDVPVRFNVYKNEIEFKQGGKEAFLDEVDMVMYLETPGDSASLRVFKTGYPDVNGNSKNTIYEVLAMGPKAHLLKYRKQTIEDVKSMGDFDKKEIVTSNTLYLYIPGKGISKIKGDKKALLQALPEHAATIEKIIDEKKLSPKKEDELAEILTLLNA